MSKATEMKRKRELAKMQKRTAKDQKRVLRKGATATRGDQPRSFGTAESKPLTGIARAAAEWMKPVVKPGPVRSKPSPVGTVVIRRAKAGGQ